MDIYAEITNRIIAKLEAGEIPWRRPWCGKKLARNWNTGRVYSLLNQLLLEDPGEYATFNQIKAAGGRVKKGAKAKMVVFWKMLPAKNNPDRKQGDDEDEPERVIPYLRYYNVFNISTDCEGLLPKHQGELHDFDPIEEADRVMDAYIAREGVTLDHIAQGRSYYSPSEDRVVLPIREQFKSTAGYYSVAFHELVHSTGHPKRLNRLQTGAEAAFGGEDYSKEELVAEIGSASIMHELGIETEDTFTNSAAYIQNWLKALKNDKRLIVLAAGRAEKAAELILSN